MSAPPTSPGGMITTPAVTDWKVQNTDKFQLRARTVEEEAMFDAVAARHVEKPSGVIYSMAQLVKGALGAGILSGHVAYMFGGLAVSLCTHFLLGVYMTYCFYLLSLSAKTLYQRTRIPTMNYSDLGEAAAICTENPKLVRSSRCFRKFIDVVVCMDLFGACTAYQLIVAKTLKQLVENTQASSLIALKPGYPCLRIYLLALMIPFILIVLIRHLDYIAPFSLAGNFIIILAIIFTIYYARQNNPNFTGLVYATDLSGFLRYVGLSVFSMSCSGVVLAVENNMAHPSKFPIALFLGMAMNVAATILASVFGYIAYRSNCVSPITINFPMTLGPKILKGAMCFMIYVTHGLNFWVPFNNCFYYVKLKYDEKYHLRIEYCMRAAICAGISIAAVIFPNIASLLSLLGTFCLSLMSFVWPNYIYLLVVASRPGFGAFKWRLILGIILIIIGFFLWTAGTFCNILAIIREFGSNRST